VELEWIEDEVEEDLGEVEETAEAAVVVLIEEVAAEAVVVVLIEEAAAEAEEVLIEGVHEEEEEVEVVEEETGEVDEMEIRVDEEADGEEAVVEEPVEEEVVLEASGSKAEIGQQLSHMVGIQEFSLVIRKEISFLRGIWFLGKQFTVRSLSVSTVRRARSNIANGTRSGLRLERAFFAVSVTWVSNRGAVFCILERHPARQFHMFLTLLVLRDEFMELNSRHELDENLLIFVSNEAILFQLLKMRVIHRSIECLFLLLIVCFQMLRNQIKHESSVLMLNSF
jgi:hypothetical protein